MRRRVRGAEREEERGEGGRRGAGGTQADRRQDQNLWDGGKHGYWKELDGFGKWREWRAVMRQGRGANGQLRAVLFF